MNEVLLITLFNGDQIKVDARFASSDEPATKTDALRHVKTMVDAAKTVKDSRIVLKD